MMRNIPLRYLPNVLTKKDRKQQLMNIINTRKNYKKGVYGIHKNVKSFHSKSSSHITRAMKIYGVKHIRPSKELAEKSGCSLKGLKLIVKKGMGAFYSSGSRPNQTPQSWGYARLASSITGNKASIYDHNILIEECNPNSIALKLATKFKTMKHKTHK